QHQLHGCEHARDAATHAHGRTIDQRGDNDRAERDELQTSEGNDVTARNCKFKVWMTEHAAEKVVEEDGKTDSKRRRRGGARDQKLGPAIDKPEWPAVRVADDAILARGARH